MTHQGTETVTEVPGMYCTLCRTYYWIDKPHKHRHDDSEECWCAPALHFVAENGTKVWVHHEPN